MERRNLANILASVLTVLCLASLLTPWWTADSHFTGSVPGGGNFDEHASLGARPFDGDGIISDGEALTAGLLALGATLAAAGAAALGWLRFRPMVPAALAAGAAALALVALVLALTTWPADEMSFWDSGSGGAPTTKREPSARSGPKRTRMLRGIQPAPSPTGTGCDRTCSPR
ncbi:MAG TPA: hypothetical protein VFH47_07275, partial [Candidatus Thermoplasmatota archaeon]|nr:hypothetical protein [Candidatus Thermoplasmatota archaeon]